MLIKLDVLINPTLYKELGGNIVAFCDKLKNIRQLRIAISFYLSVLYVCG